MANAAKTVSSYVQNVECNEPVDATLQYADLVRTVRSQMWTQKRSKRTERNFQSSISRSAIGQVAF